MYNFKCVVETIPDGADVVFMFGEIDCRYAFFDIIFTIFVIFIFIMSIIIIMSLLYY